MSGNDVPVPPDVVARVDAYVENELRNAAKYENSDPLDESGVWSLHQLAAEVYALGWMNGAGAQALREQARRLRERQRAEAVSGRG